MSEISWSWKDIFGSVSKLALILFSWWTDENKRRRKQKEDIYAEAKKAFKEKNPSGVTIAFDKLRNVR